MNSKTIDDVALTGKYTAHINADTFNTIVRYCGNSLKSRDSRHGATSSAVALTPVMGQPMQTIPSQPIVATPYSSEIPKTAPITMTPEIWDTVVASKSVSRGFISRLGGYFSNFPTSSQN